MHALECSIGMRCTLTPRSALHAEVKSRYSDFLVHEVAQDGAVVRLTRLWPHELPAPPGAAAAAAAPRVDPLVLLEGIIGAEAAAAVRALAAPPSASAPALEPVCVPLPEDRAARRSVHEAVRALSSGALDSDTLAQEGGQRCIRISRPAKGGVKRARVEVSSEFAAGGAPGAEGGGGGGGSGGSGGASAAATGWRRNGWDASRLPYVRFVLHKVNMDSASAVRSLARALGCKEKAFSYAGTKDKRAATTQHMTLYRMEPERISRAARSVKGLALGDFAFCKEPLHLGQLWGNRFTITLRRLRRCSPAPPGAPPAAAAAAAAAALAAADPPPVDAPYLHALLAAWQAHDFRFVSYFGLQRFGGTASLGASPSTAQAPPAPAVPALRTHLVGRAILAQEWEAALRLLLSPRPADDSAEAGAANAALAATAEGSCTLAQGLAGLAALPHYYTHFALEKKLLGEAVRRCNSAMPTLAGLGRPAALEVLLSIPPASRALYVHAYQSYLWNELASARCSSSSSSSSGEAQSLGAWAVEDDLVLLPAPAAGSAEVVAGAVAEEAVGAGAGAGGSSGSEAGRESEEAALGAEGDEPAAAASDFGLPHASRLHSVTAAEAASHAFPVDEVIMPVVGSSTTVSASPVWGLPALVRLLARDGLVGEAVGGGERGAMLAAVAALFTPRDARFHFTGGYRHLVGRAEGVEWKVLEYGAETDNLAVTDFERVLGERRGGQAAAAAAAGAGAGAGAGAAPAGGGNLALQLVFSLKKSHYATVALREVLGATGQ